MSYYITDDCISCGACEPECPNQAITEGDIIYIIDPERCTECVGSFESSRCAEVCPVDACYPDPDYPETAEKLIEKWGRLHAGEEPAPGTYRA
ncbi:MAG: YfhL family 4Fe-4S dicluster ferredoxin [Dehalococcoidales bacterium]